MTAEMNEAVMSGTHRTGAASDAARNAECTCIVGLHGKLQVFKQNSYLPDVNTVESRGRHFWLVQRARDWCVACSNTAIEFVSVQLLKMRRTQVVTCRTGDKSDVHHVLCCA